MFLVIKKRTLFLYISTIILVIASLSSYARYSTPDYTSFDGKTIIIDPGHGGIDGGAVGIGKTLEKDLNLKLSKELAAALEKEGYKVILTRKDDTLSCDDGESLKSKKRADTKNRLRIADENPDALFISIHMNYFEDSSAKGSQVFYSIKNPESRKFASLLKMNLQKYVSSDNNRDIKEAYPSIYIMKNTKNTAVLLECGFISNREEEKLLNREEYRNKIITAIICTLKDYKGQISLPISQVYIHSIKSLSFI